MEEDGVIHGVEPIHVEDQVIHGVDVCRCGGEQEHADGRMQM